MDMLINILPYLIKVSINVLYGSILLASCWYGANKLQLLLLHFADKFPNNKQHIVIKFLSFMIKTGVILIGVMVFLWILGIDPTALVASLGIAGLGLGVVIKDPITNTIAGLLIIINQPFKEHQYIKTADYSGQVKSIDLAYTHLKKGHSCILIPNALFFNKEVIVSDEEIE
jgi:small conductance mechanosensitive channel